MPTACRSRCPGSTPGDPQNRNDMSGNRNKKIAFNYFGGKFTWTEYLYANFPVGFTHLIDLFAGSMVVSLNYHGNVIRTANEINGEITNFFTQLRDHEEELVRALRLTPYSEVEFDNSWVAEDAEISDLEKARRFYVRVRQSFFGLGAQRQKKGWHMAKQQVPVAIQQTDLLLGHLADLAKSAADGLVLRRISRLHAIDKPARVATVSRSLELDGITGFPSSVVRLRRVDLETSVS